MNNNSNTPRILKVSNFGKPAIMLAVGSWYIIAGTNVIDCTDEPLHDGMELRNLHVTRSIHAKHNLFTFDQMQAHINLRKIEKLVTDGVVSSRELTPVMENVNTVQSRLNYNLIEIHEKIKINHGKGVGFVAITMQYKTLSDDGEIFSHELGYHLTSEKPARRKVLIDSSNTFHVLVGYVDMNQNAKINL